MVKCSYDTIDFVCLLITRNVLKSVKMGESTTLQRKSSSSSYRIIHHYYLWISIVQTYPERSNVCIRSSDREIDSLNDPTFLSASLPPSILLAWSKIIKWATHRTLSTDRDQCRLQSLGSFIFLKQLIYYINV